ncbi:putative multidrug export ATP-binding/permease protein [Variibacter gotjawalensis]|uniref:Putative multidrug export ATP-binding/permease protein n=1 Tax=Variibacter gotjawalensis TaxID=1333996 RepID=A0A0S3PSN2_9BRAD|nr:ABC transporter ATP-binding protein [Variibacter gotjawalensis]NIK49256.1 ATP-binding cassette subfamily B multidrug efflux pump [Variibacter gotjawalensis]RZS51108.1 ATP-binding cassette subfamily B multidrug efflux pump [Variibacter gotjawalensis]BAT58943.1 putative multidrug export ATP-binding/permease protein [Variibacter gotjawalensis]
MFAIFEKALHPTQLDPQGGPPSGLVAFYWHYARQAKGLFAALFVAGFTVALLDATIPVFIGRIVTLVTSSTPEKLFADHSALLITMAIVVLIARPAAILVQNLFAHQAIAANLTNLIRWQTHWHVARQSWAFFQNDFAGRIANKVMQTGPALRESIVALITGVWYILVYGTSAIVLLAAADAWLALPVFLWFAAYGVLLRLFVPRMRDRSKNVSEARSMLTGRIVDTYTNILTVKLFARARNEDRYVRDAIGEHTNAFHASLRMNTLFSYCLSTLNAALVTSVAALSLWLWSRGTVGVGTVAMAIPLAWQIISAAGWVAYQITAIFENIGVVQEGMTAIARPIALQDRDGAGELAVSKGEIKFEDVSFGYGREVGVIKDFSLTVRGGEKIGVVGRSGAGKSTLVNLLLRFFDVESGRILIDGQDISAVTQESLRAQISVVTQDTSLLHRSIRDNIRYGKPDADDDAIARAAELAHAHEFITGLEDYRQRRGYDAQVGERGVKLSGGQRQRVAIARVILKNAPILVLDEATSALDSEVEQAIQQSLETLMAGKTVIAIAHRLSTIAQMDRLVIMDHGRIVEQGSHAELLRAGGHYASLWRRQSGGFIDAGAEAEEAAE